MTGVYRHDPQPMSLVICPAWPLMISRAGALEDVYDTALDCLREAMGTARASILTCDAQGVMRFRAWRGLGEPCRSS